MMILYSLNILFEVRKIFKIIQNYVEKYVKSFKFSLENNGG